MKTYRKPSRMGGPQGLQCKRGSIAVGPTQEVCKLMPAAIAQVRWGNCHWRKRWHRLCRELGLGWQKVQCFATGQSTDSADAKNITATIEVWGSPEALSSVLLDNAVTNYAYRTMPATILGERMTPSPHGRKPPRPAVSLAVKQLVADDDRRLMVKNRS